MPAPLNDSASLFDQAPDHQNTGRHGEALPLLDILTARHTNIMEVRRNRTAACSALKLPAETLKCFDRVLPPDPGDLEIRTNRGVVLEKVRWIDEAGRAYDYVLACCPSSQHPPAGVIIESFDDLNSRPNGFLDTTAIMEEPDLVITWDTAIPHLAGARGRPWWMALPHMPEWRWQLGRADSLWYTSLRLFRGATSGNWASAFTEIEAALKNMCGLAHQGCQLDTPT